MTTIVGLQNPRWIIGEYDALHGLDGLVSHGLGMPWTVN